MLAERGLAGAGQPVEAQGRTRSGLQRVDDLRDRMARLDVEQRQVVAGRRRAELGFVIGPAERTVGALELPLDQRLDRIADRIAGQARKARRRLDLRRRDLLARGDLRDEGVRHAELGEVPARDRLAHALRRVGELEVELEAAAVGRVDLADGIRHPDRRHRVLLERLVDPGLAVDRRAARLLGAEQVEHRLADRREHVLDLVEQQRGARRALE